MVRRFDFCAFVYAHALKRLYGLPDGISNAAGVAIARAIAILKNSKRRSPNVQKPPQRKPYRFSFPSVRQEPTSWVKVDNFYVVIEPPIVSVYLSQPTSESQPIASSTVAEGEKYSLRFDLTLPIYQEALSEISATDPTILSKRVFAIYKKLRDAHGI